MYKKIIFSFLSPFLFATNLFSQQFQNIDLNGAVGFAIAPTNWQLIPFIDVNCLATDPSRATVDITDINGPGAANGVLGNPYTGLTFVSGLYGFDNSGNVFQEGIMQTVSGFVIGCQYSIKFHQAVVKQDPANFKDPSGFWRVYLDNTLTGSTAVTTSNAPVISTSFVWEPRTVNFTATATSHTIKFLPMDNDANSSYLDYTADGGVRMGIDSIYLMPNGPGSGTQNASICAGDTYFLPDGTPVTTSGIYTTIITGGACDAAITTVLTVSSGISINQNATICSGNTYTLPNGTLATTTGTYIDTISAPGGCDSIITTNLTVNPSANASQNVSICLGSTFTLPGGGIASAAGAYHDTIVLSSGCDSIYTTNLSFTTIPTGSGNISICSGNSYTLPGGLIVNTAGTYFDTIALITGCDSIFTTNLTVTLAPTSSQTISICAGSSYILPGGGIANTTGIYMDTISLTNGCDSIFTTNLTVTAAPSSSQTISICAGSSYTLPGGSIVNTAGTYTDTISTIAGCDSVITTTVTINSFIIQTQSPTICQGNTYTLPNGSAVTLSGIYLDTVQTSGGCDSIIITNLAVNNSPTAAVTGNATITPGTSTSLQAYGGGSYSWTPTTSLSCSNCANPTAIPSQTTTYCVTVTNGSGCNDTACVTIIVIDIPCLTPANTVVPNAFSPNDDNTNDEFCLQGWDVCIENFSIHIYDRWGEKVYESTNPDFCWDGKYKNVTMDSQVFVYYIKATYIGVEKSIEKKGNISLIK